MNILCIGDIFGRPGRNALRRLLPVLMARHAVDFVVVNWENAAGGRGVTPNVADELLALPVDVFTSGNHIWQHKGLAALSNPRVLRPHNAPPGRPGQGFGTFRSRSGKKVGVINLQGRAFMFEEKESSNPFHDAAALVEDMKRATPIIIVDMHAEVTSEKKAMGYWLAGKVSAVVGTHTHVQTSDEEILPGGTAYITDLGMTGPHESVLGMCSEDAIRRFLTDGKEKKWKPAEGGVRLEAVLVTIDDVGKAVAIKRLRESI